MVHTAAQNIDRRKLSSIAGMSLAGNRKAGAVPETQGGPRKIQYQGQLMDQVMKLRNRQIQTRSIETQRLRYQQDSMYTTSDFQSCHAGLNPLESPRFETRRTRNYRQSSHH